MERVSFRRMDEGTPTDYHSYPLAHFEPMVHEIFSRSLFDSSIIVDEV